MKQVSQIVRCAVFILLPSILILLLSGCGPIGVIASALPAPTIEAAYTGLAGQTVGVMVWADRAIRIDFPNIQGDLAGTVQARLQTGGQKDKRLPEEIANAKWVDARSIARYQQDHPEIDGLSVQQFAPELGVTRLIYIEIEDFQTRSDMSLDLYRGAISVSLKVAEVSPDGKTTKIGYEESGVRAAFPKGAPQEGVINANDYAMYVGTLRTVAVQISNRFMPHPGEDR
ncbi:MAG: hypothetical protein ACREIT_07065 [Tepidisphaeraceae bacterium]